MRGQGASIRTFTKQQGLTPPRSSIELKALLHTSIASGRITEADVMAFFLERTMFCNKRVYVLKQPLRNPASLGAEGWTAGNVLSPHVGSKARRPPTSGKLPGVYAGKFEVSRGKPVHVFVTSRTVEEAEELPEDDLTPEARSRHAGKRFTWEKDVSIQCFDLVVEVRGKWLLLVDSRPRIDLAILKADISNYRFKLNPDESAFVDLWDAVGKIYSTKTEGAISYLKFMSNERSNHMGSLGKSGLIKDFRKLPYHKKGSTAGSVDPYAIGVSWRLREEDEESFAALPGTTRHLLRQRSATGTLFPPLEHFDTPRPMTRAAFEHAATRVLAHT